MNKKETFFWPRKVSLHALLLSAGSFFFWGGLFKLFSYLQYPPCPAAQLDRWVTTLVGILHSSCLSCFVVLFLLRRISLKSWSRMIAISRGFFTYDLLCFALLENSTASPQRRLLYIVHHIFLLLILAFIDQHARDIAIGLLAEITNPFVFSLLYLEQVGVAHSLGYYLLGGLAVLSYFVFRVLGLSYLFFSRLRMKEHHMRVKILSILPFVLLNYYWFYAVVRKALKVLGVFGH